MRTDRKPQDSNFGIIKETDWFGTYFEFQIIIIMPKYSDGIKLKIWKLAF